MPALTAFELPFTLSNTYTALSLIELTRLARNIALQWRKRGLLWLGIAWNIAVKPATGGPTTREVCQMSPI